MAIVHSQLATEITTDPTALGFAELVASGQDQAIADLLNVRRAGITIRRNSITNKELWEAILVTDFAALVDASNPAQVSTERRYLAWLSGLASIPTIRLLNDDGTNGPVVANLLAMFGAGTGTRTRLQALAVRDGSRAEQLFGRDTVVTANDISLALRGVR